MSVRKARAISRATSSRVIVILRNQYLAIPATKSRIGARERAERLGNTRILTQVQRSGGHVYRTYHALNAFAATVSKNERSALQHDAAVKQVIPDTIVQLPAPINARSITTTKSPRAGATTPSGQTLCPSDPSKPLLEPEALQTTHTAFDNPNTPQAANLADGSGVKVATFADGLDPNNPDLIRPNGQHVIADYQDFSGDGLNAPTGAAEAFGDVSSVAAQGTQTYDISQFMNPAHPLPAGCNIKIRGIAPGATLDVMKVFGNSNSAFNSTILEGLDYALANDHPDVFSESFGGYPIPDSTQDITRQFNEQAFNAGAVVVESSGDSGVEASPSSAGSDPDVIDAGASTTFQNYAQGTQYGFQFAKGWLSDNISSIESAGFTQGGRVVDLVAPGEANWALCSANTAEFEECTNFAGQPTNIQSFGGTSESAPFIAGGAALVIQAYRAAHGGNNPSPLLVRQLMTSTATDLGQPSVEEGAGELNTLAAVQAAQALGNAPSGANGQHLTLRSLLTAGKSTFSGNLIGGNGRNGFFQPGQLDTYDIQVPSGQPAISVSLSFANSPQTEIFATLVGPNGQAASASDNVHNSTYTNGLQVFAPNPAAGTWRFVVDIINPIGGQVLSAPYSGKVSFAAPPVATSGLPTSSSTTLPQGKTTQVRVTVSNNGPGTQDYFLDPRSTKRATFSLLPLTQATGLPFPLPGGTAPPEFLMPTQTNEVDAIAQATEPVTFDWGYGDPDLPAISSGNTASATFKTPEASPGVWFIGPTPAGGPFSAPVPPGTLNSAMLVNTRQFDGDTSSSTGDVWQETVDPNAPGFSPLTLGPGQRGTMMLTITPSKKKGKVVKGTLYVDVFSGRLAIGGEVAAIPYSYTVG